MAALSHRRPPPRRMGSGWRRKGAAILDVGGEFVASGRERRRSGRGSRPRDPGDRGAAPERRAADFRRHDESQRRRGRAVGAGASIVNDIWGFQRDRDVARVVADTGAAAVLMHNRQTVDPDLDIVADIRGFLSRSIDIALAAGVARGRLLLDPGFGFGKTPAQNLEVVRRLRELAALGFPILLGVSRKSTIGIVTGQKIPAERLAGSLAAGLVGAQNGAAILRVHDVAPHVQALQVLHAIQSEWSAKESP